MNTKKAKNKQKQQKPPTPQPAPEVSSVTAEKKEQTEGQDKSEIIKSEERVPEIVSEVVQPILELKVSESDAPKKPKRNRGKKKKSDKGDEADESPERPVSEDNKIVTETPENVTDDKRIENPEVTPAARKKKNKNKKQSEQAEKQSEQELKLASVKKGEDLTDIKIVTVVPVATETSEESKSKKKNKKKKRNDSERSEKAEEIVSCTAAFQKLMEIKDDKKDTKSEDVKPTEEISPKDAEQGQLSKTVEAINIDKLLLKPETATRDKSTENKTQFKEEGGKGKKKNKKDKKHPQKEESEDEALKPLQTKTEIDSEGQTVTVPTDIRVENVAQEETKQSKADTENLLVEQMPWIEKEKSPKPKAKIAKPVEKKRKGKQEVSSTENLSEKVVENIMIEEKPQMLAELPVGNITLEAKPTIDQPVKIPAPVEQIQEIKPIDVTKPEEISTDTKIIEIKPEIIIQPTETVPETDKIHLPESGSGKKRKKSPKPKPSKNEEALDQPTSVSKPTTVKLEEKEGSSLSQESTIQKEDQKVDIKLEPKRDLPEPVIEISKESKPIPLGFDVKMPQESTQIKTPETPEPNKPIPLGFDIITPQESTQIKTLETPEQSKSILLGFDIKMPQEPTIFKTLETSEGTKGQGITETTVVKEDIAVEKEDIAVEKEIEKENIQVPEACAGKKRKKSPKPQRKPGKSIESIEPLAVSSEISKDTIQKEKQGENKTTEQSITTAETVKESPKTDSLSDLPILEDIEIRSVKADESEGSICDITPDIHYPRSSSQLQDDNNNNTVIRDITATDVKLNIPNILPDTPLIQGSGETPLPASETKHPGVTVTEISTSDLKQEDNATASKSADKDFKSEEKTDLKSKVLDVNQGMEELRRSIERSLAELSSMEKSEKEAEDQFFKAQAKLELITEMASKKSEEKKQAPPTDTQKIESEEKSTQKKSKDIDEPKSTPKAEEIITKPITLPPTNISTEVKSEENRPTESIVASETQAQTQTPPVPARKDNKGKGKKKKGKQDYETTPAATTTTALSGNSVSETSCDTKDSTQDTKKDEKPEQKTDNNTQEKGKQQSASYDDELTKNDTEDKSLDKSVQMDFEPIESFEDALYASVDESEQDINKTFEIIANEANKCDESQNPEINITAPIEDEENPNNKKENEKVNPLSQPKNLLGHPDIPARLNRTDYKKEKNKHQTPNTKQATVKIKDAVPIEVTKESKESQTENKRRFLKDKTVTESITSMTSENEEYIYKYSFRKVFLPSACHVCKKDLKMTRVPCNFCNLIFYCSVKHKDEDYQQHQGLCFAVSTIVHLRDQKHIYADAKNITGHEYRLLRMQMIVSCEKVLKRRLVPWEQEALLYPRICADVSCREWRQNKLLDCDGCGQIAYCSGDLTHLPKSHQRWCKSYSLYNKLVVYQQTRGRLEPRLPTRVMAEIYQIPEKLNEVLASMYEEKIDMTDIQYAALTQIATAPLTAAYCHQLYNNKMNAIYANGAVKKSSFTIHVVGAELQFEADALNKWEVFFLHLRPDVKDLRVVLVGPDLNPSKLPLDLLAKIKLCENCRQNKRRVLFDFQDKKTYYEYWSTEFTTPDLVCAFNPSIQRSSVFNGKDIWPSTIQCILKLKVPFIITSYTMSELQKDLARIKECSDVEVNTISEAEFNAFASVRPDRNFISDDEMPLLFKNFCFSTVCGAF